MATEDSTISTLVVTFGGDGASTVANGSFLSAELDSRPEGLNGGATTFEPTAKVYFLVFKTPDVTIKSIGTSIGVVLTYSDGVTSTGFYSSNSPISVQRIETLSFDDSDRAELEIPATAINSITWVGNSLGALELQDDNRTLVCPQSGIGVCEVNYTANAYAYGIMQVPVSHEVYVVNVPTVDATGNVTWASETVSGNYTPSNHGVYNSVTKQYVYPVITGTRTEVGVPFTGSVKATVVITGVSNLV